MVRAIRLLLKIVLGFVLLSLLWVGIYAVVPPPFTFTMLGDTLAGHSVTKDWTPLSDIDPDMARAAIAGEDSKFCSHHGFDFRAIAGAAVRNAQGGRIRGGSTISQQTAKNAFLWPGRNAARKAIEEFKAKMFIVDVMGTSLGGMQTLRDIEFFQPYWSPHLAIMRDGAVEPKRLWAMDFESYISLGYNTKEVSEADVPKTLEDLLNPKWKSKMAVSSSSTPPNWIGAVLLDKDRKSTRLNSSHRT